MVRTADLFAIAMPEVMAGSQSAFILAVAIGFVAAFFSFIPNDIGMVTSPADSGLL